MTIKPPIGIIPYYLVYPQRIRELSEAILRYVDYCADKQSCDRISYYYHQIAAWCGELRSLAELAAQLINED